jgi:acid phosphatase family membrane protein YuiD
MHHPPFLPLPDANYWNFRVVTVMGSSGGMPSPASMVDAAKWALAQPVGRRA